MESFELIMKYFKHILLLIAVTAMVSFQKKHITVYMIGDSTMSIKMSDKRPETGWGMPFTTMFDNTVTVIDRAVNGRSTLSFRNEKIWQPIVDTLQEGDYVFIQFGHNDEKVDKPGVGVSPEEYKKNLIDYINETRNKKAIPVLLTPIVRRKFDSAGTLVETHGEYPDKVREVAKELHVAFIDIHQSSKKLLEQLGKDASIKLFNHLQPNEHPNYPKGNIDDTHFSEYGALQMALLAKQGMIEIKLPLSERLLK
jgi:pectinesterase